MKTRFPWVGLALLAGAFALPAAELPPAATKKIDFVRDIQPILAGKCFDCHGPKKQQGELRWDSKDAGASRVAIPVPPSFRAKARRAW